MCCSLDTHHLIVHRREERWRFCRMRELTCCVCVRLMCWMEHRLAFVADYANSPRARLESWFPLERIINLKFCSLLRDYQTSQEPRKRVSQTLQQEWGTVPISWKFCLCYWDFPHDRWWDLESHAILLFLRPHQSQCPLPLRVALIPAQSTGAFAFRPPICSTCTELVSD